MASRLSLTPDRRLACPFAVRILLLEDPGRRAQVLGVVAPLVGRDPRPVAGLGGGTAPGKAVTDRSEALLRLGKVLMLEVMLAQAQLQLRQEVIHRQESFDPVSLDSLVVQNDLGRSPLRVEPLEGWLLLLDVKLHGQELGGDGFDDTGVRIDLGFQPGTSPTHGRRAEVQENRLPRGFRLGQGSVDVLPPLNLRHGDLLVMFEDTILRVKRPSTPGSTPLDEYAAKRAFDATPEPPPAVAERSGPLLFVIQKHAARALHYDVRLECDGVLKSWACPKGLSLNPSEKRLAVHVEDHPYDYASFEGIIPPGQYGAGEVIVWDCGVYSPDEGGTWFHDRAQAEERTRDGLAKGKLSFLLRGEKVKGSFALVRTKEAKNWLLIKHKDRFVSTEEVTARDRSVLSGARVEEMKVVPAHRMPASRLVPTGDVVPMPAKLEPMLAEIGDAAFNHPDWMWEPKLDGYRVLVFVDGKDGRLRSRRGLELAPTFPGLVEELGKQAAGAQQEAGGMILDGEIVAFDAAGKPSFNALQNRSQLKTPAELKAAERDVPVVLFVLDRL